VALRVAADNLSRIMAVALLATGAVMLHSSVAGPMMRCYSGLAVELHRRALQ
jgi:hypothetical protein